MSKFLSGRLSKLLVGIVGYTENKTVVQTTGKVGIGTTNAQQNSLYVVGDTNITCLLYTSPSPRDKRQSRMPSSA